jgi:glyoxylase-like metal-dependent hydrolase (beta-lactamase superfamily II)
MPDYKDFHSKHFTLELLTDGVFACIHKEGGAAYSNAGIIDLGGRTIVVDSFDTRAAGADLGRIAEALFDRPIDTIVLTHSHGDHWYGAAALDSKATFLTSPVILKEVRQSGEGMWEDFQKTEEWETYLHELEEDYKTQKDERRRLSLEKSIERLKINMAEMPDFKPRYPNKTFEGRIALEGEQRAIELFDFGSGHSAGDVVVYLPQDKIAFIGDIGFFEQQPYMGVCDLDLWKAQIHRVMDMDAGVLVPGHGPLGNKDSLTQQVAYFDVMEERIGEVVRDGGNWEAAMAIDLPEPFNGWLMGGMNRLEVNVRYLYERLGGKLEEENGDEG